MLAQSVKAAGSWSGPAETVTLDYEARFLRRRKLLTDSGHAVLVDLTKTTSLDEGDALVTTEGALIRVCAASEPVLAVYGPLAKLAWHIGNRHTPCQILTDHLRIRRDPVIGHMLEHLGARLVEEEAAFTPEGGAYGHGRTHAHAHGATAHEH